MTLGEIILAFKASSQSVEDVTADSVPAFLNELLDLKVPTVELRGVGIVADVTDTNKMCAYFGKTRRAIGITFEKKDFISWDGSSLLLLLDRKKNVSAINKREGKQLFDAAEIFTALGRNDLITYTDGHL